MTYKLDNVANNGANYSLFSGLIDRAAILDSKLGVVKVSDLNSIFGGTFSWPGARKIRLLMANTPRI